MRRGGDPRTLAATAGTIWVDGRMRRPVRLLRRTTGQARRGHFHQVLGMDWRVDATLGGLNIQRADEILNSVLGPSSLEMANSSDLGRARQFRIWHATCSQDCAHYVFAPFVAHPTW